MTLKIFAYSLGVLLLSSSLSLSAQTEVSDSTQVPQQEQRVRGVQYASREEAAAALAAANRLPLFAGVSVGFDVAGAVMAACTPWGQYEANARLNLRGKYFPTIEIGWGVSDHTNETTEIHYKVNSPFIRLGADYNFMKSLRSGNRIFMGLRYGFTTFKYDVSGPDIEDGIYGTSTPFNFSDVSGKTHWVELVAGVEARVWGILHLGWTVRYKVKVSNKTTDLGNPWYIPGYGRCDSHALGGTFNVIFDI